MADGGTDGAPKQTAEDSAPRRPRRYDPRALDHHPAFNYLPMSPELIAKVEASDFTPEQIAKVHAVRPDYEMIESWVDLGWPSPDEIEVWADSQAELLASTLTARTATWADHDMLTDLCANSPERVGDWAVTVERGPNPYAAYRLQEHPNVIVLEDRRVALGMSAASGRNTYIGGERTSVNFMSGWRIRDGFRGMGLSNRLRSAAGPGTAFFGLVTYYYVRQQNSSQTWISHIEAHMEDRPEGYGMETDTLTASLTVFDARGDVNPSPTPADVHIRPVTEADLPRCIELINRTHAGLDLFRPYTLDFIGYRLDDSHWGPLPPFRPAVYGWDDYFAVEQNSEVVACGGLWDRGRDIREVWRKDDDEFIVDPTALLDFGFAEGNEPAMAALVEHFMAATIDLGRSGLLAALEFLPAVQEQLQHIESRLDTREVHVLPFRAPGIEIDLTVTKPYTDVAYW